MNESNSLTKNKLVEYITKSEYPLLFTFLSDYNEEPYHIKKEYRRGSSFFNTEVYLIDQDTLDEFKQEYELTEDLSFLLGYWQTEPRMWTNEWGYEDELTYLERVERKIRTVEEEYFEPTKALDYDNIKFIPLEEAKAQQEHFDGLEKQFWKQNVHSSIQEFLTNETTNGKENISSGHS